MRHSSRALLVGALVLGATTARATPSRMVGLGDLGRYVEDDSNVLTYPGLLGIGKSAMLSSYTHFVYLDLAGPGGISPTLSETQQGLLNGGAFLRLSDGLNLGLVASDFAPGEQAAFLGQVDANASAVNKGKFAALAPTAPLRRLDLILGYAASKEFGLGLRASYGSASETFTPDLTDKTADNKDRLSDTKSQRQLRFGLGVSGTLPDGSAYDAEAHYSYYGLSYTKNEIEPFLGGAASGIGGSARYKFAMTRYWDLIPQVSYHGTVFQQLVEDRSVPAFGATDGERPQKLAGNEKHKHDRSSNQLDVGVAAALHASKLATFWVATGVQYMGVDSAVQVTADGGVNNIDDMSASIYSLPYLKFAFEAAPLDWLRLRAAVEKYSWSGSATIYTKRSAAPATETTRSVSGACAAGGSMACGLGAEAPAALPDFGAYVGASALLNGFILDVLLDNNLLKNGPFFITGAGGAFALRASLGMKF